MSDSIKEPNSPQVAVVVADGTEEMEAVIVIDVLRRAGCEVTVYSPGGVTITASRGVRLVPDADLATLRAGDLQALVIPGGTPGVERLLREDGLVAAIREALDSGVLIAAICAGPRVLAAAGILQGRRFTAYPGVLDGAEEVHLVEDDGILTSQGPGTSFDFALALVARLQGEAVRASVASGMLLI